MKGMHEGINWVEVATGLLTAIGSYMFVSLAKTKTELANNKENTAKNEQAIENEINNRKAAIKSLEKITNNELKNIRESLGRIEGYVKKD